MDFELLASLTESTKTETRSGAVDGSLFATKARKFREQAYVCWDAGTFIVHIALSGYSQTSVKLYTVSAQEQQSMAQCFKSLRLVVRKCGPMLRPQTLWSLVSSSGVFQDGRQVVEIGI